MRRRHGHDHDPRECGLHQRPFAYHSQRCVPRGSRRANRHAAHAAENLANNDGTAEEDKNDNEDKDETVGKVAVWL